MPVSDSTFSEVTASGPVSGPKGPARQLCEACLLSMSGFILFFVALYGIAANEQRNVCRQKALSAAINDVVEADCTGYLLPEANSPAHIACELTEESLPTWTPGTFGDAKWLDGGFSTRAVKISQDVSMFQCDETHHSRKEKRGEQEVTIESWTYEKKWHSFPINSANFKAWRNRQAEEALKNGCGSDFHGNPGFPMKSQKKNAGVMMAGEHDLKKYQDRVSCHTPVKLNSSTIQRTTVPKSFAANPGGSPEIRGNTIHTCLAGSPQLGCLRIEYHQSAATEVSFLGRLQPGVAATAWTAPPSWMCKSTFGSAKIELFSEGHYSASSLVGSSRSENAIATWVCRIFLIIASVACVRLFFEPMQTIANLVDRFFDKFNSIPLLGRFTDFFGNVVAGATNIVIWLLSCGIGLTWSLFVLAVAWVTMRPWIGLPLLIGAVALMVYTVKNLIEYAKEGAAKRKEKETKTANKDD